MIKCFINIHKKHLRINYTKNIWGVQITGKYIGSQEKITYICPCCNEEHESLAQSLMQGHFCKKNIGKNNPYKKDNVKFINQISNVDPQIKIIGEYKNANIPIEFICSCGKTEKKEPAQMLLSKVDLFISLFVLNKVDFFMS